MSTTTQKPYSYEHITYDRFTARPKRHQMTFGERRKFGPLACAWLESIGAARGDMYDFTLATPYGPWHLTPYDDWIATRFDDPARAAPITGGPPWGNGKWNWHYFEVSDRRITAAELFAFMQEKVNRVIRVCGHPPHRLYSWQASDGTLCVTCCECGKVLAGAA